MIRELFCRLSGYRYHYRINLKYRTKDRRPIADATLTVRVTSPKFMDEHRQLKIALSHKLLRHIPRHHLCNGELVAEPLMFIGLFKPAGNKHGGEQ